MEKGTRKIAHFLHILIAIAIFTSSISPACAFISGKETIEICTAFGVKTIEIDAKNTNETQQNTMQMMQDCMFCFAQTHQKNFLSAQGDYNPIIAITFGIIHKTTDQIKRSRALEVYSARAPPIFA